jgi:hypothetical protein
MKNILKIFTAVISAAIIAATAAANVSLAVPADGILDEDTVWGWNSDGTDEIFNGIEAMQIQKAKYLVIECGVAPDLNAYAGIAWLSSKDWKWRENNDFSLADYLIGESTFCFSFSELMPEYIDFANDEIEKMKIYFRYGDWKAEGNETNLNQLEIQAAYLTNEPPVLETAEPENDEINESEPAVATEEVNNSDNSGNDGSGLWVMIAVGGGVLVLGAVVFIMVNKKK